jgi:hypothetical protein
MNGDFPLEKSIQDLAIFGGAAAFAEPLHVGQPNIGDREKLFQRLEDMLARRWLLAPAPPGCGWRRDGAGGRERGQPGNGARVGAVRG